MKYGLVFGLVVSSAMICLPVWAGGNIRPGGSLSPEALGMGGAHNAVTGDGAAFYHNVANISQADFWEFALDTIVSKAHFKDIAGETHSSEIGLFPMPILAISHHLNERLTLGLGLYPNDGLGVEYHHFKYGQSLLSSINLTPAIAWQVTPKLSLGVGLDVVYGQLQEKAIFDQLGFPIENVFLKTKASGWGLGYRLGLRYALTDWLALGVSYASKRRVEMDGYSDVFVFDHELLRLSGKTMIDFPGRLGLGIAIKPTDKWLLAVDFDWYDYSGLDKIKFNFDWLTITQATNWGNNCSLHLGAERVLNENWKLRFGVAALWPAVPEAKTVPIIPDGMGYCFSIGTGWLNRRGNWAVNTALVYGFISRQTEPSCEALCPGKNRVDVGVVSVGVTHYFGR